MSGAEALIVNELVFLVLPNRPLDVERGLRLGGAPAVAATLDVMRVVAAQHLVPLRRDLDAEEPFIFRRIEVAIDNLVDFRARFLPVAHRTSSFTFVAN